MKKGVKIDRLNQLKKDAIKTSGELEELDYKFENMKKEKKDMYQKIYKNQL
jgi:hypothetical protein